MHTDNSISEPQRRKGAENNNALSHTSHKTAAYGATGGSRSVGIPAR